MGDDFDNLIDNDEINAQSYSSLDSVISVVNDDGEEELIDLYDFYRQPSTRKKKDQPCDDFEDIPISNQFRKRRDISTEVKSEPEPQTESEDKESNDNSRKSDTVYNTPFYRDHHILRALEIQEKAEEIRYYYETLNITNVFII